MIGRTHYEVLGVATDADDNEIKAAWRAGAKASHPDKHGDDPTAVDRFKEIQAAYELLSDPEQRRIYDEDQRPSPDPDLGWVWEPPPSPAPPSPPTPETQRRTGPASQPSWARRWRQGAEEYTSSPEQGPPSSRPCVGCGAPAYPGEIRCGSCWAVYDAELEETFAYVAGMMRLHQVEVAVQRSRRVCYDVDQARMEERYGGLGYWKRDGTLK